MSRPDPEAELTALALRLAAVREPDVLAFEIVSLLLAVLREGMPSVRWYAEAYATLWPLFEAAIDAASAPLTTRAEHQAAVRYTADRAACVLFGHTRDRGAWPLELQLPYDIATAIRRACEPDVGRMLPLIVRDARALLHHAMAGPERIDALVAAALAPTSKPTEGDTTCPPPRSIST